MRRSSVQQWREFGASIKTLRECRSWGLRPFARAVRIDPGYISLIEAGKVPPPSDTKIIRMAEVLNVPAQQLLTQAGRLPPDILLAFWQHPAIPPILSTIPGMSLDDAQTFCRQVLGTLPQSATA